MKLYDTPLSPYSARVRIALYAKGIEVERIDPFEALSPEAFKAKTPLAKVPTLETDDGWVLPESEVICEYLEEAFPHPALMPADKKRRAEVRLLARIADLYLMESLGRLFGQIDPAVRDMDVVKANFEALEKSLVWLEALLDGSPYAVDGKLTLADCALMPVIFFVRKIPQFFGKKGCLLDPHPKMTGYWTGICKDPHCARALTEMDKALEQVQ